MFIWFNRIRSSKIIRYCIIFICLNVPCSSSPYALSGIIQWVVQAAPKIAEVAKAIATTTQGAATMVAGIAAVVLRKNNSPLSPAQPAPQPPTPVPAAQPVQAQPSVPSAPVPSHSLLEASQGKTPEVLAALSKLKKQPSMMTDNTAYDLLRKTREASDAVKIPPVTKLQEAPKGTPQNTPVRVEPREIEPITIKLFDSQTEQPPSRTPTIGHATSPAKPAGHVPSNQQSNNQKTGFRVDAKITINKREHNNVTDETRQSAAELQKTFENYKNGTGFNPGEHNERVGEKNGYTVADVNKGILKNREQRLREEQLAKEALPPEREWPKNKPRIWIKKKGKWLHQLTKEEKDEVFSGNTLTSTITQNDAASQSKTAHNTKQDAIAQTEAIATPAAPAIKPETAVEAPSKIEPSIIPLIEKPVEVVAPSPIVIQEAVQPQMAASSSNQWNDAPSESDSGADYLVMAYAAHTLQKWASGDTLHAKEKLKTQPQQQHALSSDNQKNQSPSQDPEDDEKDPKKKKNDVLVTGEALKKLKDELEKKKNEIEKIVQHDPATGWCMPEKGGSRINGRYYTKHALERMAPKTPQVFAELEARALEKGIKKIILNPEGKPIINPKWLAALDTREIPPAVIENIINTTKPIEGNTSGTWSYIKDGIHVVLNRLDGDVITVIPWKNLK